MPNLKDVAAKAGVSICTVSKVLSGKEKEGRISSECAGIVRNAADELGYKPNYHAQTLKRGSSMAVGMVLNYSDAQADPWTGYWGNLLTGIEGQAQRENYSFTIIGPTEKASAAENALTHLNENRIDCLVVPGFTYHDWDREVFEGKELPIVIVGYDVPTDYPIVLLDDEKGIDRAVEHLADLGHDTIAWVSPSVKDRHVQRRSAAFRQGIEKRNLTAAEIDIPMSGGENFEETVSSARDYIYNEYQTDSGCTGMVCYMESIALGVYPALAERGIRIPEDISVIGFDNIYGHVAYPAMTVVDCMLEAMGKSAVDIAIRCAEDRVYMHSVQGHRKMIPGELVVRKSTAPCGSSNKGSGLILDATGPTRGSRVQEEL